MLVTLAAGVVAKLWSASLCACTCVCLSVCPRGYLWNHTRNLYKIFVHVDMAVAWSSFGRVTKSQWEGAIFGFFFHSQRIVQHSICDRYKTAESIEMPFGMMSGLGPRNVVLCGGDDPLGRFSPPFGNCHPLGWRSPKVQFWGKRVPDKLTNTIIANWTGPCSGTQQKQTLDCKRWTSILSTAKWGLGLHIAGEVWYLQLLCSFLYQILFRWMHIFYNRNTWINAIASCSGLNCHSPTLGNFITPMHTLIHWYFPIPFISPLFRLS